MEVKIYILELSFSRIEKRKLEISKKKKKLGIADQKLRYLNSIFPKIFPRISTKRKIAELLEFQFPSLS